ncbi:sensor histidine kinase [Saccharothrix sp. Mg75]|uniref:sensor histidine kinase n=1 Tax=Saccharothrix sp. Mg75 TaxID=3445357 RepID=UPI003EEDDFD2
MRITIRVKLTLLYGGLILVSGALLLTAVYLVMDQQLEPQLAQAVRGTPAAPVEGIQVYSRDSDQVVEVASTTALDTLFVVSALCLLGIAALSLLGGWWLSGRVLRPLHTITATARRLSAGTLHERLSLGGPRDELIELADTIDRMLDRLESAFRSQRRFVAHASHELRTPLALQRAALQIGLDDNPDPDVVRTRDHLLTTNRRIERIIDGLLLLARSDRGLEHREPVDLREVVTEVVDQHRDLAAEHRVELDVEATDAAVLGDRVLLVQLTANLVANAIRHNAPGGTAWVRTDDHGRLSVANTGRHLPEDQLPRLFEPFHTTGTGAGLGLSIVDSIARAHDGVVTATSRPGGGLRIEVVLPTGS